MFKILRGAIKNEASLLKCSDAYKLDYCAAGAAGAGAAGAGAGAVLL